MSAGSRWAKVPTSRAVPQAEGCPVSENGLLPGSEIFPVRRCRLYSIWFAQTPRTCWLNPIVQRLITRRFGSA